MITALQGSSKQSVLELRVPDAGFGVGVVGLGWPPRFPAATKLGSYGMGTIWSKPPPESLKYKHVIK